MTIGNYIPPINLAKVASSVRKSNEQAKARDLSTKDSVRADKLSQEAYTLDIATGTAADSVSEMKIDSVEQANQLTGKVASMIRQNPIEAGNVHSDLHSGMKFRILG